MTDMMTDQSSRFTVRLSDAERDQLDALAWDRRVSVSAIVRAGLELVLADPELAPRRTRPVRASRRDDEQHAAAER